MARTNPAKKARRSLIWLAVIILGLFGINAVAITIQHIGWAPTLALDLQGGTQIILTPQVAGGKP
ncbi:MAG: protein translocase subunit SecD, partial [Microbacteriaceae bacterium]